MATSGKDAKNALVPPIAAIEVRQRCAKLMFEANNFTLRKGEKILRSMAN